MNLAELTTEARNPASIDIDRSTSLEIVRLMNAEDAKVPVAVGEVAEAIATAIDVIADRLRQGGRLIYIGAGTSGRLGVLDASECPPTFNSPPWQVVGLIAGGPTALTRAVEGAEDHPELAVEDLQRVDLSRGDVLVGIATSGRTPYVIGGLEYARSLGAYAIGLSCNQQSALAGVCDLLITPVVGPEVVSGSTRLKAGTATKLVLNMLTTGAMIQLGKTYGNLMVDLQATNQKLADRSQRIVAAVTDLSQEAAAELLARCGGDVKTSIVAHHRAVSPEAARQLLKQAQGRLRVALDTAVPLPTSVETESRAAELVIGVDAGGTKTLVWIAPADGELDAPIGIGEAGPGNPLAVGWAAAQANIDLAIHRAFTAAGISRGPAAAICLAAAGAGRADDQQRLQTWAERQRLAERVIVTHDAAPILAAGTSKGVGIALIAGTGSLAFGMNAEGATARAGGWGYLLGDDGGGFAIAQAGLKAAIRAHEGLSPSTALLPAFLKSLGLSQPEDLRGAIYGRPEVAQTVASLAPVVFEVADQGDAVAQQVVETAAKELATLVTAVAGKLWDSNEAKIELALAGGVLMSSPRLRERLLAHLETEGLTIGGCEVVERPVRGCVVLGRGMVPDRG